jgi:beta-glucanase (GH16 family)
MKFSTTIIGIFFVPFALFAKPPADYKLVWSDEFNGTALDTSNWTCEIGIGDPVGMPGIGQYYYDKNITVNNGLCTIEARKETTSGPWSVRQNYTSGKMASSKKRAFKYGYFEVRLMAPKGDGICSAFGTLGESIRDKYVGWPACGETELYEQRPGIWKTNGTIGDNYFIGACHFQGTAGTSYNSKGVAYREALGNAYHIWAILWDSAFVEYYFDDSVYWSREKTPEINQPTNFGAFHNPHYFIANIDIGGNYVSSAGITLDPKTLPAQMSIDYIRVYQKNVTGIGNRQRKSIPESHGVIDPASARLAVYDLRGKRIADFSGKMRDLRSGADPFQWIKSRLPAGVYVARLTDKNMTMSRTVMAGR